MDTGMDTGTDRLLGRKDGHIGWMTFNHPERRNAISHDMWQAMPGVIAAFEADPDIKVIVLTGAGDKAFVAGADISQFESRRADAAANRSYSGGMGAAVTALRGAAKPTMAMIRGFCIGGGLAVALDCDLRFCADDARFAIPAARLGVGYGFEGVKALVDVVGPAFAKHILYTGRQFDAPAALAMGLVNQVIPVAELEAVVRAEAEAIARNAPLTLRAVKLAAREALRDPAARQLAAVEAAVAACFNSDDFAEGRRAFMEKRAPVFRGR